STSLAPLSLPDALPISNVRQAVQEGRADYTPVFLSEIPSLFEPGGSLPLDVAFLHVTPPDVTGQCSFGTSVDCAVAAAMNARIRSEEHTSELQSRENLV